MAASSKVTRPAHTWQRTSSAVNGVSFTSVGVGTKQALHEFVRLSTRIFKVLLTSSRCQVVRCSNNPSQVSEFQDANKAVTRLERSVPKADVYGTISLDLQVTR